MIEDSLTSLTRPLFLTARKTPSSPALVDCHYCQLKQKFSGPGVKCVQHTITDNKSASISPSNSEESVADRIVGLLAEAEEVIEDWANLFQHSHGSTAKARLQLQSIAAALRSFQNTFSKFPPVDAPDSPRGQGRIVAGQERKLATRSERFLTSNFSEGGEGEAGEQIKEWVLHFQRILVTRQIREELLPLQEQIDMRIFKESMERRFLSYARGYQKYEQRTADALQRLLFYMEQFGGQISQQQFKQDLAFLEEGQDRPPTSQPDDFNRLLLVQAATIQHLLAQKQMKSDGEMTTARGDASRLLFGMQ